MSLGFIAYLEFAFIGMHRERLGIMFTNWSFFLRVELVLSVFFFFYRHYNFNKSQ